LRSTRSLTRSIESDVDLARAAFDPFLEVSPFYLRSRRELLLEEGAQTGTQKDQGLFTQLSGTLPTSTGYSLSLNHDSSDQPNPALAQGQLQPFANTTLTATLRQPLLRGAGGTYAKAQVRIARLNARAAGDRLDRTAELTVADVENFYWNLGLAEAIETIARDSYDRAQQLLDRNQRMFDLKLITEVDLISARRGLQQRLTSVTEAVRRRQDAAERLWYYVYGERAEDEISKLPAFHTQPPPAQAPPLLDVTQLQNEASGARRDLAAAKLEMESAELARKVAKNALLPDLGLSASVIASSLGTDGFQLFETNRVGDLDTRDWRLGIAFTFPIRNNAAEAAHARAIATAETQAIAVASTQNAVRSEVRAAVRAVRTEAERLEQSKLGLDYARAQYDAAQKQLQLGLIDSFRLLQVEEDVQNAELVYQQVRYDLANSITTYRLATGTLRGQYQVADETRTVN
jgi:outer membrane protein TolC